MDSAWDGVGTQVANGHAGAADRGRDGSAGTGPHILAWQSWTAGMLLNWRPLRSWIMSVKSIGRLPSQAELISEGPSPQLRLIRDASSSRSG